MKRWIVGGMLVAFGVAGAAAGYGVAGGSDGSGPDFNLVSNDKDDDGSRLRAIGLTADQRLVGFRVNKPDDVRGIGKITGLTGDTKLIGIDYRVQDGKLYGVGDAGGVYTLDSNAQGHQGEPADGRAERHRRSASTSTPPPTGCASSATTARTCGTTSTPAEPPTPTRR